jgi:hypothetical protein
MGSWTTGAEDGDDDDAGASVVSGARIDSARATSTSRSRSRSVGRSRAAH